MTTDTIRSYYTSPLAETEFYQAVYRREILRLAKQRPRDRYGFPVRQRMGLGLLVDCIRCFAHLARPGGYCVACEEHIGKVWRNYGRIKYGHNKLGGLTAPLPPKVKEG